MLFSNADEFQRAVKNAGFLMQNAGERPAGQERRMHADDPPVDRIWSAVGRCARPQTFLPVAKLVQNLLWILRKCPANLRNYLGNL